MIVNHTGCLHVGITNGGTEKLKAASFHVLAYGVRNRRARDRVLRLVYNRPAIGHKAVQVFIERAKLFLYIYEQFGIVNGRQNF